MPTSLFRSHAGLVAFCLSPFSRAFRSLELCLVVTTLTERESLIDNFLVMFHFLIEIIPRTGLAPCKSEFLFPGSLVCLPSQQPSQVTSGQGHLAGVGT